MINRLNSPNTDGPLLAPSGQIRPPPFVDVSPNNLVTTLDAVLVISMLNTPGGGSPMTESGGEGEAGFAGDAAWWAWVGDWLAWPAAKRRMVRGRLRVPSGEQ